MINSCPKCFVITEGGSADPKFNRQLERAILSATKNNVPKSTIDNYLKKTVSMHNCTNIVLVLVGTQEDCI